MHDPGRYRAARLLKQKGLGSQTGDRRRPGVGDGELADVVVGLFSPQEGDWSVGRRLDTGRALHALLVALWRLHGPRRYWP